MLPRNIRSQNRAVALISCAALLAMPWGGQDLRAQTPQLQQLRYELQRQATEAQKSQYKTLRKAAAAERQGIEGVKRLIRKNRSKACRERGRLQAERGAVSRFPSSGDHCQEVDRFCATIKKLSHSMLVRDALALKVPAMAGDAFVCTKSIFEVLGADGRFTAPPAILAGYGAGDAVSDARSRFEKLWDETVKMLPHTSTFTMRHLEALDDGLMQWAGAAKPRVRQAGGLTKIRAERYMQAVCRVLQALAKPERTVFAQQFRHHAWICFWRRHGRPTARAYRLLPSRSPLRPARTDGAELSVYRR